MPFALTVQYEHSPLFNIFYCGVLTLSLQILTFLNTNQCFVLSSLCPFEQKYAMKNRAGLVWK